MTSASSPRPITATVQFKDAARPVELTIELVGARWRLLTPDVALVLTPVCDALARPVDQPPPFDTLEIWPVQFGVPDALVRDHPEEVEQMRRGHLAGEHQREDGTLTWPAWFEEIGKLRLWELHKTPELARRHLVFGDPANPAFHLYMLTLPGAAEPHVTTDALRGITFRAEFHSGPDCTTIFLSGCAFAPLEPDEARDLPSRLRQEAQTPKDLKLAADEARAAAEVHRATVQQAERAADKLTASAAQLEARTKEIANLTRQVAGFLANPSVADAKAALKNTDVPEEVQLYCFTELHVTTGRFPSARQLSKAVQTLPLFRAVRQRANSPATCWRWLTVVRAELEKRGLLEPRSKGPAARRARDYDVERNPAPASDAEEAIDQGQANSGTTGRDTRPQELPDVQGLD